MKRLLGSCLTAAFLLGCAESALVPSGVSQAPDFAPATTFTSNDVVDVSFEEFITCANGGSGESVAFSGRLHVLTHVTLTAHGHATLQSHFQPQGISGTGLVTGDKYHGVGVEQNSQTVSVGVEQTSVNVFRLVGQGPGNNLSIHETTHVTVNANGTLTSFHENFGAYCR